ncbi:MAG: phosphopantetheine-binding protein [Chitinispirillaceae bacterium]
MSVKVTAELKKEIKELIIDALKIPDVKADDIDSSSSLFEEGGGLQLDSVDALEIVMALQRKYNVHIDDQNLGRFIIKSVDSIAQFIADEQSKRENS